MERGGERGSRVIRVERREVWEWDGTIVVIIIIPMVVTTAPSSSVPTAAIPLVTTSVGPIAVIALVAASILLKAVRFGGSEFIIRRIMKLVTVLAAIDLAQLAAAAIAAVLVAVKIAISLIDAALADNAMLGAIPAAAALTAVFALTDFAARAAAALAAVLVAVHPATALIVAGLSGDAMLTTVLAVAALTADFAMSDLAARVAAALAFVFAATILLTRLGRGDGGKDRTRGPGGIDGSRGWRHRERWASDRGEKGKRRCGKGGTAEENGPHIGGRDGERGREWYEWRGRSRKEGEAPESVLACGGV